MGVSLVLTFRRGLWVGIGAVLLLFAGLVNQQHRLRFLKWTLVTMLWGMMILLPLLDQPQSRAVKLMHASFERLGTLVNSNTFEANQTSTLRWRDFEYKHALPQISSHPLLGLGFGAEYRPFVFGIDWEGFDGRRFTHNGHLWILLKSGLLGYLCFGWLSLSFLKRGFSSWRQVSNPLMRGTVLSFTLAYLAILLATITDPLVMQWQWIPVIGTMMGINEVILARLHITDKT